MDRRCIKFPPVTMTVRLLFAENRQENCDLKRPWNGTSFFSDTRITLNNFFSSSVMWQLNILKMLIVLFLRKIFEITWKSINNRQGTTIFSFLPNHTYLWINRMILTRIHFLKEKYRTWHYRTYPCQITGV